ncbi:MAG TPA: SpoIIE family protein phosphatase [Candidatus Acidoferrum sp.]|jgi:sigma-B regulation protein RsbU (phosphoserine phosphatase)|nr:SpoIIE family protein phosphatase [Candidatus Acidoferrum sp.]
MQPAALKLSVDSEIMPPRILIADDQQDVLEALRLLLKGHGYAIETVNSPAELLEAVEHRRFDLLLMDLNYARDTTSGREGLDVLSRLKTIEDAPPIVAMTGWATVGLAVEAMQFGVSDFVEKPWTNTRLLEILEKQVALGRERRQSRRRAEEETRAREEALRHLHEQEREFAEARAIQEKLLPREIPQIAGYQIAAASKSARIVGGDYFDVLPFEADAMGICIADVAGKGMPAALLMSNLQAAVRGISSSSLSPSLLCARLNSVVFKNTASDRFITFFYAQLDGTSGRFDYANAGHNPPFVMRRDGTHVRLAEGGSVLGIFAELNFSAGTVELAPGDRVILFTDGVTEACDPQGEEFGEERLLRILEQGRALAAAELQEKILGAVADFSRAPWTDDVTLLVLAVCE